MIQSTRGLFDVISNHILVCGENLYHSEDVLNHSEVRIITMCQTVSVYQFFYLNNCCILFKKKLKP